MKTKLTLRVEEELIERAKDWAKSRDMTLSDAVAQFFQTLAVQDVEPKLSPWTRRLVGAARRPGDTNPPPTDEQIKKDYIDYLEKKYR